LLTKYIKIVFCVLLFIVSAFGRSVSDDPQGKFQRANKLYIDKDFNGAINLYRQVMDDGYESPELYYNLGNAYFRIGSLGYSILYYEKALKLDPKNEDIQHNLALASIRTVDRIDTLPEFFLFEWWEGVLSFFTLKQWTILAFIIYILLLVSAGYYFFAGSPGKQKAAFIGGISSFALLVLVLVFTIVTYNREINEIKGVVTTSSVAVKNAPEENSNDAFIIHEGLKFRVEDNFNKWLKIRLPDGKTGWIRSGEAEII
jgi:hypothetical protein